MTAHVDDGAIELVGGRSTAAVPAGLRFRLGVKRGIDLVVGGLTLVLVSPVLALIAILILLYDGRPAFFRQTRVGRDGREFTMIKFRSMRHRAPSPEATGSGSNHREGPFFKDRHDPRVHAFGKFLRRTSLDELPQLLNVVGGSMSLVGPRPALPSEVAAFPADYRARERMPQGITGMWQLDARDDPDFERARVLDLEYVENWTLRRDVWILIRTPFVVIGQAFRGSAF